jgi:hypothetical protein
MFQVLCSLISYAELIRTSPLRDVSCWADLFHGQFIRSILTLAELGHKTLIASFLFVNRSDDVLAEDDLVGLGLCDRYDVPKAEDGSC